jgi:predicted permease
MDTLWKDIRFNLRALARNPGFTVVAVLALGLGIGASTAIFTVAYGLIWRPLPGAERPSELVSLTLSQGEGFPYDLSFSSYKDYKGLTDTFSDTVGFFPEFAQLNFEGSRPERILGMVVTGNYFDMLGVKTAYGRTFSAEEAASAAAGNVAVIGHDFWQKRFAGSPSIVGSQIRLNNQAFTVIGVTRPEFHGTSGLFTPSLYIPLSGVDFLGPNRTQNLEKRGRAGPFSMVVRLKPGVSIEQARAVLATASARLEQEFPDTQKGQRALLVPEPRARMEAAAIQYMPPVITVFMTLVGLVLLVACSNVANLLLARAASRQKELTIRTALGAGRWRILQQSIVESTMLAILGGGTGLLLALWPVQALSRFRPATDLPISFNFEMDYRVFLFTMVLAVVSGLVSGVLPGWRVGREDLASSLKEGGRVSNLDLPRHRFRDLLVVAQVAVCLVLLVSAGLFLRTTRNAVRQDFGFDIRNRLIMAVDTDLRQYDEARTRTFYRQLLERVRALPGVISASTATFLPIGFGNGVREVRLEGETPDPSRRPSFVYVNVVDTHYFETMGMPLLRGRDFNANDIADSPRVAVINEAMAQKYWSGRDPIGMRFRTAADGPLIEVVGITRVVKWVLPAEQPASGFYLPYAQNQRTDMILTVHTESDPMPFVSAVQGELRKLDTEMPTWDVRTMEEHILHGKMILFDIATAIVGAFGLIGIALAGVGLYGVMAFMVSQRTHEIGVRLALGASTQSVLGMVVRQALTKAGIGIAVGLIGAYGVTRLMANFLVGVSPTDFLTFSSVTVFLVIVAVIASIAPAIRATRVDPMIALRGE